MAQAIRLNRDLIEARFNLGCLWMDTKRYDAARDDWNYLHAVDRATGKVAWISEDPCTFYCTPVLGPHGILIGIKALPGRLWRAQRDLHAGGQFICYDQI